MEKDDEIKGQGNSYDFGARLYDPRVGRWLSIDPLESKYTGLSPYNFVANNPIIFIDPDGEKIVWGEVGKNKRELKRAIRFERRMNSDFNEKFKKWKSNPEDHHLKWTKANRSERRKRGTLNDPFAEPFTVNKNDATNPNPDSPPDQEHYFEKQTILTPSKDSKEVPFNSGDQSGSYTKSIPVKVTDGQLIVKYNMNGQPDRLRLYNEEGEILLDTEGLVKWSKGSPLRLDVSDFDQNITITVNEKASELGDGTTVFKVRLKISENMDAEETGTHKIGALRKARKKEGYTRKEKK